MVFLSYQLDWKQGKGWLERLENLFPWAVSQVALQVSRSGLEQAECPADQCSLHWSTCGWQMEPRWFAPRLGKGEWEPEIRAAKQSMEEIRLSRKSDLELDAGHVWGRSSLKLSSWQEHTRPVDELTVFEGCWAGSYMVLLPCFPSWTLGPAKCLTNVYFWSPEDLVKWVGTAQSSHFLNLNTWYPRTWWASFCGNELYYIES